MLMMVRRAVALFFVAHGVAHLIGFLGSWQLGDFKDAPYTTLVLNGAIDVGDPGMRLIGLLWIAAAIGFIAAGVALWRGSSRPVAAVSLFSLAVCFLGLPAAVVGLAIDAAILVAVLVVAIVRPASLRPVLR